ncbi:MAG: hypothetical protein M1817_006819 [Caeruleum heppii]|nr:MAG: hypothetical protein M1817_006819 [Caeruleum heppii]
MQVLSMVTLYDRARTAVSPLEPGMTLPTGEDSPQSRRSRSQRAPHHIKSSLSGGKSSSRPSDLSSYDFVVGGPPALSDFNPVSYSVTSMFDREQARRDRIVPSIVVPSIADEVTMLMGGGDLGGLTTDLTVFFTYQTQDLEGEDAEISQELEEAEREPSVIGDPIRFLQEDPWTHLSSAALNDTLPQLTEPAPTLVYLRSEVMRRRGDILDYYEGFRCPTFYCRFHDLVFLDRSEWE